MIRLRLLSMALVLLAGAGPILAFASDQPAASSPAQTAPVGVAPAAAGTEAQERRMVDAIVSAIPMHKVIEAIARQSPQWPIQDHPGAMDATQLTCVRGHMREAEYRKFIAGRVGTYARDNPTRLDDDIRMMEGGVGRFFQVSIQSGLDSMHGAKVDSASLASRFSPDDIRDILTLGNDPHYRPLRELLGVQEFSTEDPGIGEKLGGSVARTSMVPMMLNAMSACHVPVSALQKK